ncbi:MAG: hypothetical protein FWE37_07645 [Spirochaetaceae bacterium]|nr:hypothetical protein [Spirochaetaceae bacterium]
MKTLVRFLAVVLSLIILLGAVLLIGYASLTVPAQSYGFFSGRSGYSIAQPGLWQARNLLPFYNRLVIVPAVYHEVSVSSQNNLPNTDLFSRIFFIEHNDLNLSLEQIQQSFSYSLSGNLWFRLTEEGALAALNSGELQADDQASYYVTQAAIIANFMSTLVPSLAEELFADSSVLVPHLNAALMQRFSGLQFNNLSFTLQLPNLELYQLAVSTALARARAVDLATEAQALQTENNRAEQAARLELLEQYGQLLTRYPLLLQLFALDINGQLLPRAAAEDFFMPLVPAAED